MDKEKIDNLAEIFKALSHPTRLQIICGLMKKEECNVSKMVEHLNIPQPTVSQHINILKTHGIIEGFRKGNQICYKLTNKNVVKMIKSQEG